MSGGSFKYEYSVLFQNYQTNKNTAIKTKANLSNKSVSDHS